MNDIKIVEKFVSQILISIGWRENKDDPLKKYYNTFYQPSAFWPKNQVRFTYNVVSTKLVIWGRTAFDKTLPKQYLDVNDPGIKEKIIKYAESIR